MLSLIPLPYRILIALALAAGLFGSGYYAATKSKNEEIAAAAAEFQLKEQALQLAVAEAEGQIKEVIVTEYVDRIKIVKEKEYVYREQAETSVPATCELPAGWVYLHDAAATSGVADPTRSSDATPSGVKDNQALGVVAENYSICRQNAEQLISLQKYVTELEKAIEDVNRTRK